MKKFQKNINSFLLALIIRNALSKSQCHKPIHTQQKFCSKWHSPKSGLALATLVNYVLICLRIHVY